jgi:hypothetical protein
MERRQFILGAVSFISALFAGQALSAQGANVDRAVAKLRRTLEAAARKHRLLSDRPPQPTDVQHLALQRDVRQIEKDRRAVVSALQNASDAKTQRTIGLKLQGPGSSIRDRLASRTVSPPILGEAAPPKKETVEAVAIDIILETLGIADARDAMVFLLLNYAPISQCYDLAVRDYRQGNYRRAAFQLARLPGLLRDPQVFRVLAKEYGDAKAGNLKQRIAIALGVRVVPGLGQVATATLFALAVYNNWDRLQQARNRA